MKRTRNLLVGILLVALAIGFTSGLRGVNTTTQATELDFSNLLSLIEPAVVQVWGEYGTLGVAKLVVIATGEEADVTKEWCEANEYTWEEGKCWILKMGVRPIGSGFVISESGDTVTDFHVVDDMAFKERVIAKGKLCLDEGMNVIDCEEVKKVVYHLLFEHVRVSTGVIGVIHNPGPFPPTGSLASAQIKGASKFYDLALLSTRLVNPARVWCGDSSSVRRGHGAFVIGYPAPNSELTVTEAQISNIHSEEDAIAKLVIDGKVCELYDPEAHPLMFNPIIRDDKLVGVTAPTAVCRDGTILKAPKDKLFVCDFEKRIIEVPGVEYEEISCSLEKETREYLQTDDAIDHGNSGGPVFNWNGQVIGVAVLDFVYGPKVDDAGYLMRESAEYHTTINKAKEILGICPARDP